MESQIHQLPCAPPPPISPPSVNVENYCRDCGVMFESNTSLQVHLTYHKENLLSRWVPTTAPGQTAQIPRPGPLPKMESKSEPSSNSPHYINQSQHFSQNFPHFGQSIQFLSPQQNQFSPNQFEEGRLGPRIIKERNSGEQPAEILDLDSNRVHLYNIQQEQSFYRPYLMAQPPPSALPSVGNGWSQAGPPDAHYASHPYSQEIYSRNTGPPPPNPAYNNYIVEATYVTPHLADPVPAAIQQHAPQPVVHRQQSQVPSPVPRPPVTKKDIKNEVVVAPEMMRGKGKGGACKRPKAYECTSCSKWFTSSGHLKRHYGTTLHKNSAQQNGTEGMEPAVGPGRGKGKKPKKIKMEASNSGGSMESNSPRPLSTSGVDLPRNGNNGIPSELSMPLQTTQYGSPHQHQVGQPAYLYISDSQLMAPQHHAQFVPHFEATGSMYNSHSISLPSIYNTSVGYPIMEVPLPPFNAATPTQYSESTSFQHQNENGIASMNGSSPDPVVVKNEPHEKSPEVVRGASPRSPTSWLSPDETSPENSSSLSSPFSGHDPTEPIQEFQVSSLETTVSPEAKEEPKQLIQCPNCTKTFSRTCYLTQHQNSSHSPEGRPFKCPLCGKKFPLEPALSEHVSKHGGNKPYKCSICPKDFNHKTDLRRHLCQHTGTMPFTCSDCGKGFIRKDHMVKHTEIHRKNSAKAVPAISALSPAKDS